jgi:hypothetical protein
MDFNKEWHLEDFMKRCAHHVNGPANIERNRELPFRNWDEDSGVPTQGNI